MTEYKQIEDDKDFVKDMHSKTVINTNKGAYLKSCNSKKENISCTKDELRDATREINILKSEMHEIKNLLVKLVEKDGR